LEYHHSMNTPFCRYRSSDRRASALSWLSWAKCLDHPCRVHDFTYLLCYHPRISTRKKEYIYMVASGIVMTLFSLGIFALLEHTSFFPSHSTEIEWDWHHD
jgi:hypothetical protein